MVNVLAEGQHTVFAKKAGIVPTTFQNYLNGRMPNSETLINICSTYNVSIDWILTGYGEMLRTDSAHETPAENGNVIEVEHADIIRRFDDKAYARDLNLHLLELERLSPEAFRKVGSYIKGVVDGIRIAGGGGQASKKRDGGEDSPPPARAAGGRRTS